MNGKNVHRILSKSYRHWLPPKQAYYLGDFSLKYNSMSTDWFSGRVISWES